MHWTRYHPPRAIPPKPLVWRIAVRIRPVQNWSIPWVSYILCWRDIQTWWLRELLNHSSFCLLLLSNYAHLLCGDNVLGLGTVIFLICEWIGSSQSHGNRDLDMHCSGYFHRIVARHQRIEKDQVTDLYKYLAYILLFNLGKIWSLL